MLFWRSRGNLVLRLVSSSLSVVPARYLKGIILVGLTTLVAGMLFAHRLKLTLSRTIVVVFAVSSLAFAASKVTPRLRLRRLIVHARNLSVEDRETLHSGPYVSWMNWSVDAETRRAAETAKAASPDGELVIGRIDNDGRVMGPYGKLPDVENVERAEYVKRRRNPVDIVLIGEGVFIRKDFNEDRQSFAREWLSCGLLEGKANVPSLYRVDETHLRLYKRMLRGRTLRDLMVEAGAKILTVQVQDDPELSALEPLVRIKAVWARGRAVMPSIVGEGFVDEIKQQLNEIHALGITGVSLTFGNIMVAPDGAPWLIDFDRSRFHRSMQGFAFRFWRNRDRVTFKQIFN